MSRKLPLAGGEAARTTCASGLLRIGVEEKTGEFLSAAVLAGRVGWAADLVSGMVAALLTGHWNAADVDVLAAGEDATGRPLPSNAWMALRRLGWTAGPADGIRVNDRIVRIAQEAAGRTLRAAKWRADLTTAVIETWPADPAKRTPQEWDRVREAVPGGEYLPSSVIKGRTRQIAAFVARHGRMPMDVFEVEAAPRVARMLLLSACDGQQATIERADDAGRALLRLQLPTRPDPRSYKDWTWVACPIKLPPTVPAGAVLHLPTLRIHRGRVRADLAYTHAVPKTRRSGHTVALGVDWGLNTLLSAGAARLHADGTITALGSGGMFRAGGCSYQAAPAAPPGRAPARQGRPVPAAHRRRRTARPDGQAPGSRRGDPARVRAPVEPQRRPGVGCRPLGCRSGSRRRGHGHLCGGPALDGGPGHGPHDEHPALPGRARADRGPDAAPGRRDRYRRGHRPGAEHLQALPAMPRPAAAPQGPRPAHHHGLEVGAVRLLRLAGRPRPGRLEAHRRPRPHPPDQDRRGPHHRCHGHPHRDRHTRSGRGHHPRAQDQPDGPVQDRNHPAPHHTSDAQATPDTLPHQTHGSGGPASGGTRSHGPDPAAPRS